MFGQRPLIAQAVLGKITKGKAVQNDDAKGLADLYYSINDCLVTLQQLNYSSDLQSSDTLRQVVQRLPSRMHMKWAEHSLIIRRKEEPNLKHLNEWLQVRVLAMKEAYLPRSEHRKGQKDEPQKRGSNEKFTAATAISEKAGGKGKKLICELCSLEHLFWKCEQYEKMNPVPRFQTVKRLDKCFNCLAGGHKSNDCSSTLTCRTQDCDQHHHTTLHGYFTEGGRSPKVKKDEEKTESSKDKDSTKDGSSNNKDAPKVKHPLNGKDAKKDDQKAKKDNKNKAKDKNDSNDKKDGDGKKVSNGRTGFSHKDVYLMVVQVKLVSKDGSTLETYAILDDCSESTFIRHDIAKRLGWHMQKDAIDLSTIKGEAEESTNVHQMKLEISSINESFSVTVKEAYAVDKESFNMPARPKFNNCKGSDAYKLDGIILDAIDPDKITVLIGADVPEAHIQQDVP